MSEINLIAVDPSWADAPKHGDALGTPIKVRGVYWTPVLFAHEDDPTFFKTRGLISIREMELDYDARPNPKTDRFCVKCQKDIHSDSKARKIRIYDGIRIIHPEDSGLFLTWETFLVGMDCARQIGLEWSVAE